jgi:hypothetical protein
MKYQLEVRENKSMIQVNLYIHRQTGPLLSTSFMVPKFVTKCSHQDENFYSNGCRPLVPSRYAGYTYLLDGNLTRWPKFGRNNKGNEINGHKY